MIEDEFRHLEAIPSADAARVERRVEVGAPLGVVIGVSFPSRARLFIVEGRRAALVSAADLDETRGLTFRLVRRDGPAGRDSGLEIEATDSRYNEVFAILADDVAAAIRGAVDESHAVAALQSRLLHWRRFLERTRPGGLSAEAHRGLYGELLFLRDHLAAAVGIGDAVRAWRGPSLEVQDFVLERTGFEVKTTVGRGNQNLTISSEHQLDDRGLNALYLYHLSMDAREGVGETLPTLIDELRARCGNDTEALANLNDLLIESGYIDGQRELYEDLGFVFREEHLYEVRDGFPRVTERGLSEGVARVRYAIAVSACMPFSVPLDETLAAFARART